MWRWRVRRARSGQLSGALHAWRRPPRVQQPRAAAAAGARLAGDRGVRGRAARLLLPRGRYQDSGLPIFAGAVAVGPWERCSSAPWRKARPSGTRLTPPDRLLHERRALDPGTRTPGDSGPGSAMASEPRGKIALNQALSDGSRSSRGSRGGALSASSADGRGGPSAASP